MIADIPTALRLTRVVNADPQTAFDAWTQPEQIRRWACPEGHSVVDSQVDLRVGGEYVLKMRNDAEGSFHTAVGTYREIDAPRRLAYTWDWVEDDHKMDTETLVTVEFRHHADGTEVVLSHEAFPNAEITGLHVEGWESCLGKYEAHFAGAPSAGAPVAAEA